MKRIFLIVLTGLFISSSFGQDFEQKFQEYGLVDIQILDSTFVVDLMYASENNFTGENMYGSLTKAYLRKETAQMLVTAHKLLKEEYPHYRLKIMDAARPLSIQHKMYNVVAGTPNKIYVANPNRGGGHHNFGVAVDVTIIDKNGQEIPMGSPVDHFGEKSHTDAASKGLISLKEGENRALLIRIMTSVGFRVYSKEWWHFEHYSIQNLRANFPLLDF